MSDFTDSAAILSSSLNSIGGSIANTNLNKTNRKWSEKMANLSYQRQQELTMKAPTLQKIGLIDAGISPAAMNGYSGGVPTVNQASSPSALQEFQPFDFSSVLQGLMASKQMANLDANTEKTQADAKAQELANKKEADLQKAWEHSTTKNFVLDDNGNQISSDDPRFAKYVDDYYNTHGELPEMQSQAGVLSEDAARVQASISKFNSDLHTNDMYSVQSDLAKKVAQMKLADSSVMNAIYHMDKAQYDLILKQISRLQSDIDVNATVKALNKANTAKAKQDVLESVAKTLLLGTQRKAIQNSSVNNLVDQLDSKKSFSENAVTLGKILLGIVSGFNGVSL